jgi:Glycosyltransferase Family 4
VDENQPRIPGVQYYTSKSKLDRLRYTRFAKYSKGLLLANQLLITGKAKKLIQSFQPDIILTVSIRLMWLNAFRFSEQFNIPLYVILHDDWLTSEDHGKWQNYLAEMFGKMYRHASGRFCISPTMEKYYFSLYGVHGNIIYPSRGKEDHIFPIIPEKTINLRGLKFCYAGSLYTGDFAPMLDLISYYIGKQKGELHIFSYWDKEMLAKYTNLSEKHVIFHPFMHSAELMHKMNEEMDVAVLLNSFIHEEQFRYNFSSKLVDYITAGLPVMFWGPASSGSITWAQSLDYTAIVTEQNSQLIAGLIKEFNDEGKRLNWAKQIRELGLKEFSYEQNYDTFINNISS